MTDAAVIRVSGAAAGTGFARARHYGVQHAGMGERLDAGLTRRRWDDVLRLLTSLRIRTVSASLVLRQLSATPHQSGFAQSLRQMGRIERMVRTLIPLAAGGHQPTAEALIETLKALGGKLSAAGLRVDRRKAGLRMANARPAAKPTDPITGPRCT